MTAYTPTDAVGKSDIGYYLRATVSYTDPQGSDKTAMMTSEYSVQAARNSNNAPKFADDQDPVEDEDQADAAREVAENTAAGIDIGAPVVATDADADVLTYTLEEGADAASFDIDWATGQLKTKGPLDAIHLTDGKTMLYRRCPGHGPGRRTPGPGQPIHSTATPSRWSSPSRA